MRVESNYYVQTPKVNQGTAPVVPQNEAAAPSQDSGLDTVTFTGGHSEHFDDVFAEMQANVPDRTTTIEEKELALSYINRMLACEDIPNPDYWENKKVIIENEIQNIKNESMIGQDTNFDTLEEEFWEFSNTIWNRPVEFDNVPDRVEYWTSYYNTCISYLNRLLACEGITDDKKDEYTVMKNNMLFDLNNQKADLNRYNAENGRETESFGAVLAEMRENVPSTTTTLNEKMLAISYIDRMLSCNDIGQMEKYYWLHQKEIIQQEMNDMSGGDSHDK